MFSLQQAYSLLRLAEVQITTDNEKVKNREYDLRPSHTVHLSRMFPTISNRHYPVGGYNSSSSSCSSGGGSYIDISEPEAAHGESDEIQTTVTTDITDIRSNREAYELSSGRPYRVPPGNGSLMYMQRQRSRVPAQLEGPTIVTVSPEAYDSDEEYDSNSDPSLSGFRWLSSTSYFSTFIFDLDYRFFCISTQ